jgi:hypothetical protein
MEILNEFEKSSILQSFSEDPFTLRLLIEIFCDSDFNPE